MSGTAMLAFALVAIGSAAGLLTYASRDSSGNSDTSSSSTTIRQATPAQVAAPESERVDVLAPTPGWTMRGGSS